MLMPLTMPLNPRVLVTGIDAARSSVFKSNLLPMLLWFETEEADYPIIFKNGDDLRQDQLVIMAAKLLLGTNCTIPSVWPVASTA
jgi:phosphatidylinositol 3-kinase